LAIQASAIYDQIIPRENYGGEYSALQWFADYVAADQVRKRDFVRDPQVAFFFNVYGGDNFAVLKEYLFRKYRLREIGDEETRAGQDRKVWLEDTILFENPRRESWEKTSELLKLLKIKPGQQIADVGSGPGYYSFQFAKMVGPTGHVYSIEMNAQHLKYVENAKEEMGVTNISTVETDGRSIGLAGIQTKVDAVFLCSLYHNLYAMSTQPERDSFVNSIKESLNEDGTLYLVDNGLVPPGVLPYHGPYVAKELIIGQMLNYGFELIEQRQYIPQRYLLIFKVKKAEATPVVQEVASPVKQVTTSKLGRPQRHQRIRRPKKK
jgi:SAM-dependent methyltransferase